ncbi:MAG: hypothetical protein AAGH87_00910 [Pseudomonadota bacterium]
MRRLTLLLALAAGVAGCASAPAGPAPETLVAGQGVALPVVGEWTHFADGADGRATRGEHLTRFGLSLDRVWLVSGLRQGQRLVEASAASEEGSPYGAGNAKGLVESSLWALGYGGVGWALEPRAGQGAWGPVAAFDTVTDRGLRFRGGVRLRRRGEALDLALWIAEARVYAPQVEGDAQAMLDGLGQGGQ